MGDGGYERLSDTEMTRHFMPRLAVPDHEIWLAEDERLSARARAQLPHRRDLRYGPGPRQILDIFPAEKPGSPVLVFFHGGYWRGLSKEHYSFIAEPFRAAGFATVLVEYDLCPAVTLPALVQEIRDSVRWIHREAAGFNGDSGRIILAGNSAGAHLAAMMLVHDWRNDGLNNGFITGAALVTGIYDLNPIPRIQVRDDVKLTQDEIAALSPLNLYIQVKAPCLVAVGGAEPELWIEQSRRFHTKLLKESVTSQLMVLPRHHHFSITRGLGDANSLLFRAIIALTSR
jgi:arylformamidase